MLNICFKKANDFLQCLYALARREKNSIEWAAPRNPDHETASCTHSEPPREGRQTLASRQIKTKEIVVVRSTVNKQDVMWAREMNIESR